MKTAITYTIDRDEVKSHLHYDLIASVVKGTLWDTGSNKRKLHENFSEEEISLIENTIYKKATEWYLRTGVPSVVSMFGEEYSLWRKLYEYCVKNFTVYGGKNNGLKHVSHKN